MKTLLRTARPLLFGLLIACCAVPVWCAQDPAPVENEQEPAAEAAVQPTFGELLKADIARLAALVKSLDKELVEGRWEDFLKAVRAAVPERDKEARQALAYGETLWPLDRDEALGAFARAHALMPDDCHVLYAHGRVLHAKQKYAEALAAYTKALEGGHPAANVLNGLIVDLQLRLGQPEAAAWTWNKAGGVQFLGDLERDLRVIHGPPSLELRRQKLLAKIAAGDDSLIEELIALDCLWQGKKLPRQYERVYCQAEGDQVNSHRAYLKHDLALAKEKLGKDARRYIELEYLGVCRMRIEPNAVLDQRLEADEPMSGNGDYLPPSNIERTGRKLGFVGSRKFKQYPHSSRTAPFVYRVLFMDGVTISVEWIDLFGEEIEKRAKSEAGDVYAAAFLLDLYAEAIFRKFPTWETLPEKRELREQEFWTRYQDVRIAWRILERKATELAVDDPLLLEATRLFPDDLRIALVAAEAARRAQKPQAGPLAAQARAALAEGDITAAALSLTALQRALPK